MFDWTLGVRDGIEVVFYGGWVAETISLLVAVYGIDFILLTLCQGFAFRSPSAFGEGGLMLSIPCGEERVSTESVFMSNGYTFGNYIFTSPSLLEYTNELGKALD